MLPYPSTARAGMGFCRTQYLPEPLWHSMGGLYMDDNVKVDKHTPRNSRVTARGN